MAVLGKVLKMHPGMSYYVNLKEKTVSLSQCTNGDGYIVAWRNNWVFQSVLCQGQFSLNYRSCKKIFLNIWDRYTVPLSEAGMGDGNQKKQLLGGSHLSLWEESYPFSKGFGEYKLTHTALLFSEGLTVALSLFTDGWVKAWRLSAFSTHYNGSLP